MTFQSTRRKPRVEQVPTHHSYKKRALIIRCGALGDTIFATSAIDVLHRHYGGKITIDFVAQANVKDFLTYDPRINQVFTLDRKRIPGWFHRDKQTIIQASRDNPYDFVINLETSRFLFWMMRRIDARQKIGPPYGSPRWPKEVQHEAKRAAQMVGMLSDPVDFSHGKPILFEKGFVAIKRKHRLPIRYLVISPAVKSYTHKGKSWPTTHWKKLIELILEHTNLRIVLIGTSPDHRLIDQFGKFPRRTTNLCGETDPTELISIIKNATLFISPDTGTCHIAAATHTPLISLFGPTSYILTGPYNYEHNESFKVLSVYRKEDSFTKYLPDIAKRDSMAAIQPENVLTALLSFEHIFLRK